MNIFYNFHKITIHQPNVKKIVTWISCQIIITTVPLIPYGIHVTILFNVYVGLTVGGLLNKSIYIISDVFVVSCSFSCGTPDMVSFSVHRVQSYVLVFFPLI